MLVKDTNMGEGDTKMTRTVLILFSESGNRQDIYGISSGLIGTDSGKCGSVGVLKFGYSRDNLFSSHCGTIGKSGHKRNGWPTPEQPEKK